jgi:hypothetical protein
MHGGGTRYTCICRNSEEVITVDTIIEGGRAFYSLRIAKTSYKSCVEIKVCNFHKISDYTLLKS